MFNVIFVQVLHTFQPNQGLEIKKVDALIAQVNSMDVSDVVTVIVAKDVEKTSLVLTVVMENNAKHAIRIS